MAVNVEPTAKVIDDLAEDLRRRAIELDCLAAELRKTGDLELAAIALTTAMNHSNMRIDLLVARPVRELSRQARGDSEPRN